MPFLDKPILIELLNKYEGIEDVGKKLPASKKWYSIITDTISDKAHTALEVIKKSAGKNTKENSLRLYYELKASIIKACNEHNPDLWVNLICQAGEAGYETKIKSVRGSKLSSCAFALRCYILNKIDNMYLTINEDEPLSEDQEYARQIKLALDKKIREQCIFIETTNKNINNNKQRHSNNKDYEDVNEKAIIERQRLLCYLNKYKLLRSKEYQVSITDKPNSLKVMMDSLFPDFEQFDFVSRMYNEETRSKINIDLPLVFQPNYDAIFIRSKENDLQNDSDANAISNFEERVLKRHFSPTHITLSENVLQRPSIPKLKKVTEDKSDDDLLSNEKSEKPVKVSHSKKITGSIVEDHYKAGTVKENKTIKNLSHSKSKRSSHQKVTSHLASLSINKTTGSPEIQSQMILPNEGNKEIESSLSLEEKTSESIQNDLNDISKVEQDEGLQKKRLTSK